MAVQVFYLVKKYILLVATTLSKASAEYCIMHVKTKINYEISYHMGKEIWS